MSEFKKYSGRDPLPEQALRFIEEDVRRDAERERYKKALEEAYGVGHNNECMFCGLKDKRIKQALKEGG
jgi:hypothetical protein